MGLARTLKKNGYCRRHLVLALVMGIVAMVVAWPAWVDLYRIAMRDPEASQVILAPFLCLWLIWCRKCRVRLLIRKRTWLGPVIIGFGIALYIFGDAALVISAWYLGAIVMVVGALVTALGAGMLYRFAPAFLILMFLIPVPGSLRLQIAGPLQSATAGAVGWVFEFTGMDIARSGNLLIVNGNPVTVAEACNGMRMTFALILVAFAFAFSIPMRLWVRVLLLVCSPLIAVACNVIRLIPTLWVYGHMEDSTAQMFHDVGAWIMLGVSLAVLMGVVKLLRWLDIPLYQYSRAARN